MCRQQIGFKLVEKIDGGSLFIESKAVGPISGVHLPTAALQWPIVLHFAPSMLSFAPVLLSPCSLIVPPCSLDADLQRALPPFVRTEKAIAGPTVGVSTIHMYVSLLQTWDHTWLPTDQGSSFGGVSVVQLVRVVSGNFW